MALIFVLGIQVGRLHRRIGEEQASHKDGERLCVGIHSEAILLLP